jgi:hypothetical protein
VPNFYHVPARFFTIIDVPDKKKYAHGRKLQREPMQLTGVDWVPLSIFQAEKEQEAKWE